MKIRIGSMEANECIRGNNRGGGERKGCAGKKDPGTRAESANFSRPSWWFICPVYDRTSAKAGEEKPSGVRRENRKLTCEITESYNICDQAGKVDLLDAGERPTAGGKVFSRDGGDVEC